MGKVVIEDGRVGVVTFGGATTGGVVGAPRTGAGVLAATASRGRGVGTLFVVVAVNAPLKFVKPAVDLGLGFDEALFDVVFDYGKVIYEFSDAVVRLPIASGRLAADSYDLPSKKEWSRSSSR